MRAYPSQLLALAEDSRIRFLAVSEAIRRRAVAFGLPSEKMEISDIGVDTSKFIPDGCPITERPRRVLFVGRLVEKKGCECLLRAFAEVQRISFRRAPRDRRRWPAARRLAEIGK